jgi:hypothetical protein
LKKFLAALGRALPIIVCDACGLIGAVILTYGVALVYLPAGYMVCGAILFGGAVVFARKG